MPPLTIKQEIKDLFVLLKEWGDDQATSNRLQQELNNKLALAKLQQLERIADKLEAIAGGVSYLINQD